MSKDLDPKKHIYLFDYLRQDQSTNSLKAFLLFLKKHQIKEYSFSYANHIDSLHPNLSIKDNLLLDSLPSTIFKKTNLSISEYLYDLNNPYIKELIFYVNNFNQIVSNLTDQEIKIVALIKSLVSQHDYIFLNEPDKYLDSDQKNLVHNAIMHEAHKNNRAVFIKPFDNFLWPESIDYIVGNENMQFTIKENPLKDSSSPLEQLFKKAS